jgi:hypothetical protein
LYGWGGGQWGEMNQALYAHTNNKRKMKKKCRFLESTPDLFSKTFRWAGPRNLHLKLYIFGVTIAKTETWGNFLTKT